MVDAYRLFLVEDDDDIALLIGKNLERAGHQVTRCRSAADALIVLSHGSYDLVLLDHRLPDMAGLDLLEAMNREGIATPALMVTAYGDEHLATRVLRAGALDYIIKDHALNFLHDLSKRVGESVTRFRLQQMNRLLSEALESARDGVIITDLQGAVLHVNQALERMTGYDREELRGQTPRLLHRDTASEEAYLAVWERLLDRKSWQGELVLRRQDGTALDVSLAASPVLDGRGQLTHCVGIYRDVSERKQLERQLLQAHKMQSLGTLAGGVAHEFNNLLAGISGYTELALREPGAPEVIRHFLENVKQLSERAAKLTSDMLAYARRPDLRRQPTDVAELLRSTADFAARTLKIEVELDVRPPAGGAPLVAAAADELRQALISLALNSRDALDQPAPVVFRLRPAAPRQTLRAFPASIPPGDYLVLEVADAGRGMTAEVLAQALDPFFTTKEVGRGTGLGLPLVLRVAEAHHGFLSIESVAGQGTCVGLYLPRWADAGPPTRPPVQEDSSFQPGEVLEPEASPGRHILVVDDEAAVRDVVRRFLEIAGHQVACAGSGAEAAAWVEDGRPLDLVIFDLMMPGEDSAAIYERLRGLRPDVPVLLCTGQHESAPVPAGLQDGSAGLLRKPFRMTELWYAVRQALKPAEG